MNSFAMLARDERDAEVVRVAAPSHAGEEAGNQYGAECFGGAQSRPNAATNKRDSSVSVPPVPLPAHAKCDSAVGGSAVRNSVTLLARVESGADFGDGANAANLGEEAGDRAGAAAYAEEKAELTRVEKDRIALSAALENGMPE